MSHTHRRSSLTARRRQRSVWPWLCVALWGVTPAWADPAASATQAESVWLAASDAQLGALRGGFQVGEGLMVSFGISRVAYINDRLVASSTLNLGDLNRLTAMQAGRLSQQLPLRPAASATAQPPAFQETQPPPLGRALQGAEPPQVLIGPQTTPQAQVIQNGPGNVVQALDLPWATVIQNSLSEQLLRSQTVINVSTNGLGALRYLNLQNTLDIALRTRPTLR
jgi:hypothetical protein